MLCAYQFHVMLTLVVFECMVWAFTCSIPSIITMAHQHQHVTHPALLFFHYGLGSIEVMTKFWKASLKTRLLTLETGLTYEVQSPISTPRQ